MQPSQSALEYVHFAGPVESLGVGTGKDTEGVQGYNFAAVVSCWVSKRRWIAPGSGIWQTLPLGNADPRSTHCFSGLNFSVL